jgi:hypothetical protein
MEQTETLEGGRKVAIPISMSQDSSPAGSTVACPSCGHVQDRSHPECSLCGFALNAPGMIYQRQADGTWAILKDVDLSSLAPRPIKPPRQHFSRPGVGLIALLILFLAFSSIWAWRQRRSGATAEALEISQYVSHPVGTIVPQFQLQIQRSDAGYLRVTGLCNLPTATQLEVRIFADDTVVAIDYPVTVADGRFETRTLLNQGRPFAPGAFRIRVKADFADRWQPPPVLLVVGSLGQRLQGPLVHKQEDATGATLTYTEAFTID